MRLSLLYLAPLFFNINMARGFSIRFDILRSFSNNIAVPKNFKNTLLHMRNKKNYDFTSNMRYISPYYKPRSENQGLYVKYLCDNNIPIVIGVGPAGSGKTLFACNQAVLALKSGAVDKIILTRPVVPVEEDIGFLPGSLINKMDPWTRPIFDILLEFYQQKDIDGMLHSGALEISPLAYMRGRTFKKAFIIADEMQNSSPNQMLMLTTRIGDGSKMVITGDLKQSDRGVDNGLADIMRKIKFYNDFDIYKKDELGIRIVEMDSQDIQRSPIVAKLLDIYCGKPMVSHHAPSFSRDVSGGDSVDGGGDSVDGGGDSVDGGGDSVDGGGDSVDGGVADVRDWSVGVENVVHPKEINSENSIVKNDVFIDNISEHEPFEMEYKIPDNDAALIPLKYTKSKHFPKDFTL
jgi:phosphate starvation-inducible PhoH-like protein